MGKERLPRKSCEPLNTAMKCYYTNFMSVLQSLLMASKQLKKSLVITDREHHNTEDISKKAFAFLLCMSNLPVSKMKTIWCSYSI